MTNLLSVFFGLCSVMGFLSVYRLWKDKRVCGVSLIPSFVYTGTNLFEVIYFAHQYQWFTAVGASLMFTGNALWLTLALAYRKSAIFA